jgi:hypothetical protein
MFVITKDASMTGPRGIDSVRPDRRKKGVADSGNSRLLQPADFVSNKLKLKGESMRKMMSELTESDHSE